MFFCWSLTAIFIARIGRLELGSLFTYATVAKCLYTWCVCGLFCCVQRRILVGCHRSSSEWIHADRCITGWRHGVHGLTAGLLTGLCSDRCSTCTQINIIEINVLLCHRKKKKVLIMMLHNLWWISYMCRFKSGEESECYLSIV